MSSLATGKYGCTEVRVYPVECGEKLGRDPQKFGSSKSLVLKSSWAERTFWDSSLLVSLTLWDTLYFLHPHFPSPKFSPPKQYSRNSFPTVSSKKANFLCFVSIACNCLENVHPPPQGLVVPVAGLSRWQRPYFNGFLSGRTRVTPLAKGLG